MKTLAMLRVLTLSLLLPFLIQTAHAQTSSDLVQGIVQQVKPSLVRIQVVLSTPSEGRETKSEAFGSGIIISPDGYVVTNHHVAGKARWISCTLANREQVDAKLVGTDALSDIAVIKLDSSKAPYPTARWGNSSALRVGDAILAMGSPLALSQSVTSGIVSNTELIMPDTASQFMLDGEDVGSIVRWIGHDAQIHPGNSGGPLVNMSGEIVGINEIELGLSGAIPGNLASLVAAQLIEKGKVKRAYTGIELQPRLRQDTHSTGALVGGVLPASPAAFAGVKPGDLLLVVDDEKVDAKFPEQVPLVNLVLSQLPLDYPSELVIERAGQTMSLSIKPALREQAASPSSEIKGWGLTGCDITPYMAREYALPSADGVLVTGVQTGGPSGEAEPTIQAYDIIAKVAAHNIKNVTQLKAISATIPASEGGKPTLVEVLRKGERILTVVAVHQQADEDTSVEVAKPFFPASSQVVTSPLVTALKLPTGTQGVRLTQIYPHSATSASGLQVGDVLTKIDGAPIEASAAEDDDVFPAMIRQYKIGTIAKFLVLRQNGNGVWVRMIKNVKLPQAPKSGRELKTWHDDNFGMTIRTLTYMDRIKGNAAPAEVGVMVTAVEDGSWAALAGLQEGHVIRSIDGVIVNTMEAARTKLKSLERVRPKWTTFFVSGGLHTGYIEIQSDWSLPAVAKAQSVTATDKQ